MPAWGNDPSKKKIASHRINQFSFKFSHGFFLYVHTHRFYQYSSASGVKIGWRTTPKSIMETQFETTRPSIPACPKENQTKREWKGPDTEKPLWSKYIFPDDNIINKQYNTWIKNYKLAFAYIFRSAVFPHLSHYDSPVHSSAKTKQKAKKQEYINFRECMCLNGYSNRVIKRCPWLALSLTRSTVWYKGV